MGVFAATVSTRGRGRGCAYIEGSLATYCQSLCCHGGCCGRGCVSPGPQLHNAPCNPVATGCARYHSCMTVHMRPLGTPQRLPACQVRRELSASGFSLMTRLPGKEARACATFYLHANCMEAWCMCMCSGCTSAAVGNTQPWPSRPPPTVSQASDFRLACHGCVPLGTACTAA